MSQCSGDDSRQPLEEKEWTLLFYVSVADPRAEEEVDWDLDALREVGSNEKVNVVVHCRKPGTDTPAQRLYVKNDGSLEPYEPVPASLASLGDPETLMAFVKWADHFFPSRGTFLVMWGHGHGVAAHVADDSKSPLGGATPKSIYVSDWGDDLTIADLAYAFGRLREDRGRMLDIVGFDACFMQGVEVAFELRESVGYTVGSALGTTQTAWDYTEILKDIQASPTAIAETVAGMVLRHLGQTEECVDQTLLSVLNLAQSKKLVEAIAELVESLERAYDSREIQAAVALQRAAWVDGRQLPDLGDVCARLADDSGDGRVRACVDSIKTLLKPGRFVVCTEATDTRLRAQTGVSILVPSVYAIGEDAPGYNLEVNEKHYRSLDFARKTRWAEWVYSLPVVLDELKKLKPKECRWFL